MQQQAVNIGEELCDGIGSIVSLFSYQKDTFIAKINQKL